MRFADVNGNGLPDFLVGIHGGESLPTDYSDTWLNTGTGWLEDTNYASPFHFVFEHVDAGTRLLDLNGDGLVDVVQNASAMILPKISWNHNGAAINQNGGWAQASYYALPINIVNIVKLLDSPIVDEDNGVRFADLNGNGLPDILYSHSTPYGVFFNNGNGWTPTTMYTPPPTFITDSQFRDHGVRLIDLNNDGMADFVVGVHGGESLPLDFSNTWLNTGTGWLEDKNYALPTHIIHDYRDAGGRWVDFNGDGFVDFVQNAHWSGSTTWGGAWMNRDGHWEVDSHYNLPAYVVTTLGDNTGQDNGVRFVDLNGNGLPDMVWHTTDGAGDHSDAWLNKAKKRPDYLTSITDGLGEKTSIDYEPLSGRYVKVYDQEFKADGTLDSQYPNPQFDGPIYVVYQTASDTALNDPQTKEKYKTNSKKEQAKTFPQSPYSTILSDVDGAQHITTYHYSGARMNKLGYGFLGFHKIQTTDDTTGITTTTTYSQVPDQHHLNQAESTVTQQANGMILSRIDRTWNLKTFGDGNVNTTYYLPYVKEEVKETYDLKGNSLSKVTTDNTIDDYANPLEVTISTQDSLVGIHGIDIKNKYYNDTTNWHLGELTDTSVMRSAPYESTTRESHFDYDSKTGMLMDTIVEPNDSNFMTKTTYTRDTFGNITSKTISGNNFTTRKSTVTYDSQGRFVTSRTNALGQITEQTMDPRFGKPMTVKNLNHLTTNYIYDNWGRLVATLNPDGTVTRTTYQWTNNNAVTIGMDKQSVVATYSVTTQAFESNNQPIGPANTEYFDQLNRSVAKSAQGLDGTLIWSNTFYDELGRVVQQCQKHFEGDTIYSSRFEYDVLGRMTKTTNPDSSIIQVQYNGLSTTTINPLGQKSTKVTNAIGKIIKATDNEGRTTTYAYDAYGNMTSMTNSKGNTSTIQYDKMGRKTAINDPDKGKWAYEYDALGNLIKQTDANGKTLTMQYDLLNRMISRTDDGNTSTWTYGNDSSQHNVGQLIKIAGVADNSLKRRDAIYRVSSSNIAQKLQAARNGIADYTSTITYDDLSRPSTTTVKVNDQTHTSTVTYDAAGRVDITKYANNIQIKNDYNNLGFLIDKKNASTGTVYWKLNSMDAEGHITKFTRSNGLVTTKTYDPANGFLTDIETQPGTSLKLQNQLFPTIHHYKSAKTKSRTNTDSVQNLHYTYDTLGNVQQKANEIAQTTDKYQYDDFDRLANWSENGKTQRTYQYDELGNITYKSDVGHYHYGDKAGPHAVTNITDDSGKTIGTMQYDADGNQTSEILNGKQRTISYTSYGKPLQIQTDDATVNFYYNSDRNRFIRVDTQGTNVDTTVYLGNLEFISHKRGTKIESESKLNVGGALIDIGQTSATVYEILNDNLGSTTAIADANGNVIQRFSYTPFGEQIKIAGDAINRVSTGVQDDNPITHQGFTGHEMIESVNLIHMNGRLYDPVLGRFLSADPQIQDPTNSQSLNRYTYCMNNPLAFTDPTGYGWLSDLWHDITHVIKEILTNQYVDIVINVAISCIPGLQWYVISGYEALFSMTTTALEGNDVNNILQAGIMSFISASMGAFDKELGTNSGGIGTDHWFERSIVHGLSGGGIQTIEGGNFADGFLASAVLEGSHDPIGKINHFDFRIQAMGKRSLASGIVCDSGTWVTLRTAHG